jgi:tryptophan-rich sensory protein
VWNRRKKIVIKPTPAVFLRNLILIEFVWALAATLLSLQFSPTELYNDLQLARFASFNIILTIVVTTFQILIIALAFIVWYTDAYEIDRQTIIRRRGGLFGISEIAQTQILVDVQVSQSKLGTAFNYGTLSLTKAAASEKSYLIEEKTICRVVVLPAPEPVYLTHKNQEEFYIRTGNASQPLTISQAVTYVQTHFKG